jgi:hypothetical protein
LIILLFPFTKQEICAKASKLKIKRSNFYWTDENIQYLKYNYKTLSYSEMAKSLNKTSEAITQKAYRIGLLEPIDGKWIADDIDYLIEHYSFMDNKELSIYFKRSIQSIIDKAISLDLKKKVFNKKYNPNEFLDNVKIFANELGRTPLMSEIFNQNWGMTNASINRYFGGYRNVCKILDLDININIFGSVKPMYKSKNNDLCWSKAEMIITNFFIDNNIIYKKEVYYKDYSSDARFNNKTADWIINDNIFIEYFGMMDKEYYYIKAQNKINLCNENNIILIPLISSDLTNLNKIFEEFIPT